VDRLTAHPGASPADSRRAPFETLLDHAALEVALARLTGANGLLCGVGALSLALFITVAYPHLSGFRTGWLCALSAALFAYGVIVPIILRRGRHRLGMFLYGALFPSLVAGYAFLVGRNLSESVAQGVVICAASIPILFARRPTLLILTLALTSTTLVFVYERTSYSADRSVILIVQTVMFTALMFWFAQTLFSLSAIERQAKAESEANRARLAGVDERRRNFMNGMSHELRTPLNAIIGFSDMMLRGLAGSLNGRHSEYMADIRNSGLHLLGLVDEVLDTDREESSDVEVLTSVFSLEEAGRQASTVVRTDAEARGITIDVRSDAGAGYLVADERKVIQILLNLLSNGIKFTPPGGVIEVEVSRSDGWSEVRVVDHGPGVDPADAQRIFGAFEQGRSTQTQAGGTGLGLAVARHLAEVHGGELFLEQTPGGGATFVLRLPDHRSRVLDGHPDGAAVEIASPRTDSYPGILDDGSALALLKGDDGLARQRARAVGIIAVLETLGFNVLGLLPGHIRVPGWPWIAIVAIVLGLSLLHPKARLTANQFYVLHVVAVGALAALVASMDAAISASLATVLVMAGLAAFTWFRLRRALLIFAEIGVLYALILAFQHGDTAPAARWVLTMGLIIQGAVMARYLLRRLPSIVESESRARQEIEEVNVALDEATRRKSEFLASMSHELRTPLNAIIGFAGVLRAEVFGQLEPLQLDYVTDIEQAGRHLLALINDTLDLAKADAGRLELHRRLCVVEELIESVVEPARFEADAAGVRLEVSLDQFDRPVIVDAPQMARALGCIVQNALAVTSAGGAVRIEAQATPAFVVLEVTDTGHQPDTCDYERIFASFEDAGDRLAEPGSRVAYALAHRIAELHGGSLTVGQVTAAGACFSLSIPFTTGDSLVAA
jgi:signal transduction histidine kinase